MATSTTSTATSTSATFTSTTSIMAQVITNSGHDDMIHDAVLDYYGRRLATCSSDKTIKIFEVEGDTHRLTETLKGHEGAVWCVSWAHPKFGNILASSSYDGKVLIWRESSGSWTRIYDFALHTASVNLLSWSPHETGCHLACASSDGFVSVLSFNDDSTWTHQIFQAHGTGVNAVSWAPAIAPGAMEKAATPGQQPQLVRRFVTGGSDCAVRIWEYNGVTQGYSSISELSGHTGWVRDVSWSPSLLGGKSYIASASQDRTVRIWTSSDPSAEKSSWQCKILNFECLVWRVSWSLSGNVLAVSGADNKVTLWKERVRDGGWECIKTIEE